jgi:hypothetical protein
VNDVENAIETDKHDFKNDVKTFKNKIKRETDNVFHGERHERDDSAASPYKYLNDFIIKTLNDSKIPCNSKVQNHTFWNILPRVIQQEITSMITNVTFKMD